MGRRKPGRPRADAYKRNAPPHFQRIAEALRERIFTGQWQRNHILPPMRALARKYGVSLSTMNYALEALKHEHLIAPTMRRRLAVIGRSSASYAMENTVLIVLGNVLSNLSANREFAGMFHAVEDEVSRLYSPFLVVNDSYYRTHFPLLLFERPLRGVLIFGPILPKALERYAAQSVPSVVLDQPTPGLDLHSVSVDNAGAAKECARLLAAAGHKRIAFLRRILNSFLDVDPDSKERQAGLEEGLAAAGLRLPSTSVYNFISSDRTESPAVERILDAKPPYTAVVCVDGGCGQVLLDAATARGLTVPRDLSMLVFGAGGTFSGPGFDFEKLGRQAVRLLLEPRRPARHARAPFLWVEGKTMAPPRATP